MRIAAGLALLLIASGARADDTGGNWCGFPIIMWQHKAPAQYAALRALGVTAGTVIAPRGDGAVHPDEAQLSPLRESGLGFYVENIATDFYSAYHRWTPEHPPGWLYAEAKRRYRADPNDPAVFRREPSLSDPAWLDRVTRRVSETVRAYRGLHPLYYSLADEAGIAEVAGFWDFDVSDASLDAMRVWLRSVYPSLAALNAEWGTRFETWDAVRPMLTDEALRRDDGNYAAWSDFKAWMDEAFARAVRAGAAAAHASDPAALAAIEGAQVPGWGGYDYTRLATAVDAMEIYPAGGNMDIARSINPRLKLLTTTFDDPDETGRIWHALLEGSRGLVIWDENDSVVRPDGATGARGERLRPVFDALHGEAGALLTNASRERDAVAILYSPESLRVAWLLERKRDGKPWADREAEDEDRDTPSRAAAVAYRNALMSVGVQPRYVAEADLDSGDLSSIKVLILPRIVALSDREAEAIRVLAAHGGRVVADSEPGLYDGHGKQRGRPALEGVPLRRIQPGEAGALRALLTEAHVEPTIRVRGTEGVDVYVYRTGAARIIAMQRRDTGPGEQTATMDLAPRLTARDVLRGESRSGPAIQVVLRGREPAIVTVSE